MDTTGMQPSVAALSFVSPIGYNVSRSCGYCTSSGRTGSGANQSFSYYAAATSLKPSFYEKLLDRSWRRSGRIMYRPDPRTSCCPHYTVRVRAAAFRPTKDQRQAVNRFNRYVTGADYTREATRLYPLSRAEAKKRDNEFDLVHRVHEAEAECLKQPPQPSHDFSVSLEPDSYTDEKYSIFENYQRIVHKEGPDEISPVSFRRFLCDSPLERGFVDGDDGKTRPVGSFHQCYRLDGTLVAVAALDLLPSMVSSVYFFYHESIHNLSPGKLSAMREIAMALEEGYTWWYPGYYIPRCPKMRYKTEYSPQEVLDPATLRWSRLDSHLLARLETEQYISFSQAGSDAFGAEQSSGGMTGDQEGGASQVPGTVGGVSGAPMEVDEDDGDEGNDEDGDAEERSVSLWKRSMPGVPNADDMASENLDRVMAHLGNRQARYEMSMFREWEAYGIDEWPHFKTKVAQFIAALGPDLMSQICIDMRYIL